MVLAARKAAGYCWLESRVQAFQPTMVAPRAHSKKAGPSGLETHPSTRLDWYAYASDEFLPRNYGYGLKTINNECGRSP